MNKINLKEGRLEDNELREWVSKLYTKIETLNERTKSHTLDIKKLEKKVKELKCQIN